jgi:hypothetical protein
MCQYIRTIHQFRSKLQSSALSTIRMTVVHIVLFGWKPEATKEQIDKVRSQSMSCAMEANMTQACSDMLGLKDNCVHAKTNKPYIVSATGGKNISPEGHHVRNLTFNI